MLFQLLWLAACKGGDPSTPTESDTDTDADSDTDADTDDDTDTDTDVETGDTAPPEPPLEVDCSTTPSGPFTYTVLSAPRGYHGLAFDELGGLVGGDNTNMLRATDPDTATLWIPNTGTAQQMDYLPNGDLAVASDNQGRILTVPPGGGATILANGVYAYGLEIGPDGKIWTANQNIVQRFDPVTGDAETVLTSVNTPKVLNFNREGTLLYVGTNGANGAVWEVDLDVDYNPTGAPRLIGNTGGSWHDGLGVDACGRLYINEFWTRTLYMLDTDGTMTPLIDFAAIGSEAYGHGIQWGSGVGAWSDHSIFVPRPYGGNRIAEIELGVPSKDYNGGNYVIVP